MAYEGMIAETTTISGDKLNGHIIGLRLATRF